MSTDDPNPSDLPPAVRETLDSLGGALGDIAELDKEQLNETIGLLETLGHDQAAGILRSRREVLKGAGAATGLGIAGLAGATATGGARAQSDTQTGTIGNGNQDADLQDVSAESVNTGEQNNNEINLTRLVEDGTYQDIAEAIAEEPATTPDGTTHVIEPGSYTVSNSYTAEWSQGAIAAAGTGTVAADWWSYNRIGFPVVIEYDDGGTGTPMVEFNSANTPIVGHEWRGIKFKPTTLDTGSVALRYARDANPIASVLFEGCSFWRFAGPGFEGVPTSTNPNPYNFTFRSCQVSGGGTTIFPNQTTWGENCIMGGHDGFTAKFNSVSWVGGAIDATGSEDGIIIDGATAVNPTNFEANGNSGQVAIKVDDTLNRRSHICGRVFNWGSGVELTAGSDAVIDCSRFVGNTDGVLLNGGPGDHGNTRIYNTRNVSAPNAGSGGNTGHLVYSHYNSGNIAAGDLVPGETAVFDRSNGRLIWHDRAGGGWYYFGGAAL